jgi:hypothetical protein
MICLNGGLRLTTFARGATADLVGSNPPYPAPIRLPARRPPAAGPKLVPGISNEIRIEPLGLGNF